MADNLQASRVLLTLFVFILLLASAVRAEEFVSDQYGFRFRIPHGFHERTDDTSLSLRMFAEDEELVDGYLITIHIQPLGQIVDPSQRLAPAELPKKDGLKLSLETRPWRDLELQVIRQDATIAPDVQFIGYLIQIPLKDEAVQIRVQGPQNRAEEVQKVFNESVQGFVNTKTYVVRSEVARPGKATRTVVQFIGAILAPCVMVAIVILFVILVRRSQTQTHSATISATSRTLPNSSLHGGRPVGITILAALNLLNGAWIGGQRLLMIADLYMGSQGRVNFAGSYTVAASADVFFGLVAIVSGIGLLVGAKWGWWLAAFHWSCRICRDALIPVAVKFMAAQSVGSTSDDRFSPSSASGALVIPSLILVYLFQASVIKYFGFEWTRKIWTFIKVVGAALLFSIVVHSLKVILR